MPIVDGFESTRLIRTFEEQSEIATFAKQIYGRVPIFAISGGLQEHDEERYVNSRFDGWIPKPFDPTRLALYLSGMADADRRREGLYQKGKFAKGGWFERVLGNVSPMVNQSSL
jgi:CheY-like chemotaxis protein